MGAAGRETDEPLGFIRSGGGGGGGGGGTDAEDGPEREELVFNPFGKVRSSKWLEIPPSSLQTSTSSQVRAHP